MNLKNSRVKISLICISIFIIFLIVGIYLYDIEPGYHSDVVFILAESIISIPITLILIEWVIKSDREKQWDKVKSSTYMSILEHVTIMARSASSHSHIRMQGEELRNAQILERGFIIPKKEVAIAIIELSRTSKKETNNWIHQMTYGTDIQQQNELIKREAQNLDFFYTDIKWRIDDIISTLVPRVLQLSDDNEINLSLLRFEKFCRRFNEFMNNKSIGIPMATKAMPKFLSELGLIYDVILSEIPLNEREEIVLFLWPWDD